MTRTLFAALALAAAALTAQGAPAGPAAASGDVETSSVDVTAALLSDVRTRGVSDSFKRPGLRLSVLAAHESGLVALAELATVSRKQFLDGDGLGLTLAGGYRWGDPEAWHFGLGLATELFPGAGFEAPHAIDFSTFTPVDFRRTRYDSRFAVLEAGWGRVESRLLYVVSNTYRGADTGGVCGTMLQLMPDPTRGLECYARGDHGSRGTWLFDLDYKHPIAPATTLNLHAGYQKVANYAEADFADWRVGVTHKHWGLEWSADLLGTHTKVRELYLAVDGDKVRATDNTTLLLSVAKTF